MLTSEKDYKQERFSKTVQPNDLVRLPVNEGVRRCRDSRRLFSRIRNVLVVRHVLVVLHLRLVRRSDFLRLHLLQVQALEPAVAEDVVGAGLQVAIALGEIGGDEFLYEGL